MIWIVTALRIALLAMALLGKEGEAQEVLSTLGFVEEQRFHGLSSSNFARIGNVDRVTGVSYNGSSPKDYPQFCHVINMNTFEKSYGLGPVVVATTALALEHLNAGNGVVIPAIEGLNEWCPIRFTSEFLDTKNDTLVAMTHLIDDIFQRKPGSAKPMPCAFLGNTFSSVSIATSVVTGIRGFAQLSVTASSAQLDNRLTHSLFARVGPSSSQLAQPLLDYLYHNIGIRRLVVIASTDQGQFSLASGFKRAESNYPDLRPISVITIPSRASGEDYKAAVQALKLTKIRFFVAFLLPDDYEALTEEAAKLGLLGNNEDVYTWILNGVPSIGELLSGRAFDSTSALAQAARATLLYNPRNSLHGIGRYDAFDREIGKLWKSEVDQNFLVSKFPPNVSQSASFGEFSTHTNTIAAMMYDSAILLGLSACNLYQRNQTLLGKDHYDAIMRTDFQGASGHVAFDPDSGARHVNTSNFELSAFEQQMTLDGKITFKAIVTAFYSDGHWEAVTDVRFADGTTTIPPDVDPAELNMNFIGRPTRTCGCLLAAILVVTSMAMIVWTWLHQKSRVIKASQPLFLHLICVGTTCMGLSIITLSVDDEIASVKAVTIACFCYPYLMVLGWCVAFSALFSKTRQINRIFHKPALTALNVLVLKRNEVFLLMALLLVGNAMILLAWSILSPLRWAREIIWEDEFGQPISSVGFCQCREERWFWSILAILNGSILAFAIYQAYVARKIATEFAESESIYQAMSIILIATFVACPVVIMVNNDPGVFFFVRASYTFVVGMSLILFLFVPKIVYQRNFGSDNFKQAVKESLERLNNASRSAPSETPIVGEEIIGTVVLEHPKLQRRNDVCSKIECDALVAKNRELQKRLALFEAEFWWVDEEELLSFQPRAEHESSEYPSRLHGR